MKEKHLELLPISLEFIKEFLSILCIIDTEKGFYKSKIIDAFYNERNQTFYLVLENKKFNLICEGAQIPIGKLITVDNSDILKIKSYAKRLREKRDENIK